MSPLFKFEPDFAVHPGGTLREKLEDLQITPKEFAVRTGKPEQTISKILNEKSAITPDMAVQFEKVLNIPAKFWLDMQADYDEYIARQKQNEMKKAGSDWARQFPYAQMAKAGWVKPTRKIEEKTDELLSFYNVSKPEVWQNIYIEQELPAYFRVSLKNDKNAYATSALLRYSERTADQMDLPPYNKQKLKHILPELKQIMVSHTNNFLEDIRQTCATTGIAVVFTHSLPKTGLHGVVRWYKNHPVILMTDREKRYDLFWFSFFHELGHLYLHGQKKNIFLEQEIQANEKDQKEQEADNFAGKWLLTDKQFEKIKDIFYTEHTNAGKMRVVNYYAQKYSTHPAIIIGRLLRDNKALYPKGWGKHIPKVDFDRLLKLQNND